MFTYNLAHTGRVPFLLKKSAKLRRSRKPNKKYQADYGLLVQSGDEFENKNEIPQTLRRSESHTDGGIEPMKDEKEESVDVSFVRGSLRSQMS